MSLSPTLWEQCLLFLIPCYAVDTKNYRNYCSREFKLFPIAKFKEKKSCQSESVFTVLSIIIAISRHWCCKQSSIHCYKECPTYQRVDTDVANNPHFIATKSALLIKERGLLVTSMDRLRIEVHYIEVLFINKVLYIFCINICTY